MFSASPVRASLLTRVSCARVDGTAMGRLRTGNSLEAVASMSRSDTTSTSIWQAPMPSSLRKTLNKKVNHYPLTMSACERGMQGLREAAGAAAIGAAGDAAARHQSPVPRRSQTILDVIDWTLIKGSWAFPSKHLAHLSCSALMAAMSAAIFASASASPARTPTK